MRFAVRLALVVAGVVSLGVAYAFVRGVPELLALWPYSTTYGLSKLFVASILAAIGAPIVWIGISGDLAAIRPGAINIMSVAGGLGIQAVWKVAFGTPTMWLIIFAVAAWGLVIATAVMLFLSRGLAWRDPRPTPWLARGAFALFTFMLLIAGGLLIQGVQIFPWVLDRDSSIAYGIIFLGAAAYFVYGLVEPVWSNAKGQLIGFLAYDVVLFVPYVRQWPSTVGDQRLGLTIYLAVLAISGAVAIWFLFFSPIWRLGRGQGTPVRNWRRSAIARAGSDDLNIA